MFEPSGIHPRNFGTNKDTHEWAFFALDKRYKSSFLGGYVVVEFQGGFEIDSVFDILVLNFEAAKPGRFFQ